MPDKPGFRVRAGWRRPEAALLSSFGNASQRAGGGCHVAARGDGRWVPSGVGVAADYRGGADGVVPLGRQSDAAQGTVAGAPGDILVMNTQGNVANSGFGELMATSAVKIGVRGVIWMARCGTSEALEALQLPVYSRGVCPNGCNKDGAGEVGAVIACGGVAVRPVILSWRTATASRWCRWRMRTKVARLSLAQMERERKRKTEIERGVLVRPEIDEYLRKLKIIE